MNTRTSLAALLLSIALPAALAAAPSTVSVSTSTQKAVEASAAKPVQTKTPATGKPGTAASAKPAETLKVSTETAKGKAPAPVQISTAAAKAAPRAQAETKTPPAKPQETAKGPALPPAPKGAVPPPQKPGEPPPPPPDGKPQPEKPAPLTSEDVFPSGLRDPFHAGATMGTTTVNIARKDRPDITDLNPDAVTLVGFSISRVGRFAVLKDTKKNARFYLRGGKFYSERGTLIKGMSGIVQDGRVTILAGRTVKDLYIEPRNKPGAKSKTGGDDTSAK